MNMSSSIEELCNENEQLTVDMAVLDDELKCLKEYREGLLLKKNTTISSRESVVQSALQSLIGFGSTDLIHPGSCLTKVLSEFDSISIAYTNNNPTGSVNCLGCGLQFKKLYNTPEPSFYIHCITECAAYKLLNLIVQCGNCHKLIINQRAKGLHSCHSHLKPDWMTQSSYERSKEVLNRKNKPVSCKGCGKELRTLIDKSWYRTVEYVHMIEECIKYRESGLIQTCQYCQCKFINAKALRSHKCKSK